MGYRPPPGLPYATATPPAGRRRAESRQASPRSGRCSGTEPGSAGEASAAARVGTGHQAPPPACPPRCACAVSLRGAPSACWWPAATPFRRTARLLIVTRRMQERGRVHAGRAAVVEGEVGRAAIRSAKGAVAFDVRAGWGVGCWGRRFLDEWEAVMRCHAVELQAEGHTLLSCSPLLQGQGRHCYSRYHHTLTFCLFHTSSFAQF